MNKHSWNDLTIYSICTKCNLNRLDYLGLHSPSRFMYTCSGVNIFSCCGGKSGSSRWDNDAQGFRCSDCGSLTSTDPSYVGTKVDDSKPWWAKTPKACCCGGSKAGTTHAHYCDLYDGMTKK